MGKLVHLSNATLDPIIENEHGSLDRGAPSDELFVHLNNLIRPLGTHLNDRRLYETIAPRETGPKLAAQSDLTAEFTGIETAASRGTSR
jgi:hypothetical protein